ncbi:MAG: hypothetical protein L0338_39715 [Acidobacteria bacterium]|nr:hypothetical protein [Acidobacteriota bacterium]
MAGIKVKTQDGTTEVNNVTTVEFTNGTVSSPGAGIAQVTIAASTASASDKIFLSENFQ